MIAIIDIGSNALRLSVYTIDSNAIGGIRQVYRLRYAVGLAGYADECGIISAAGIAEVCAALKDFRSELAGMTISETHAFATSSLRSAPNASEIISAISRETNFDVEIISGEEEAMCGYVGVSNHTPMDNGLLVDIGGGSTEIVECRNGEPVSAGSAAVGALRMYSKYITQTFPTKAQAEKIRREAIEKLPPPATGEKIQTIIGLGGTMRALSKLNYAIFKIASDNCAIRAGNVKKILEMIDTQEMLDKILHVIPDRIHTITPGLIILDVIIDLYGCTKIVVSDSGVREGYLIRNVLQ